MTAATAQKTETTKTERRERGATYKDVQIVFLTEGLGKVEKLFKADFISPATLRRAADNFVETKAAGVQSFLDFVEAKLGTPGRRGRKPAEAGDVREYRTQQVEDGGIFIRLPVNSLVNAKGAVVKVTFEADRIVVKAS
jgi:hypothetical protein